MSNFKSVERVAGGRFEITIIPELNDTKSNYQLIVSITKCKNVHYTLNVFVFTCNQRSKHREYILSELHVVEKQVSKELNSVQMIDTRSETVRLQLSSYKEFKLDTHVTRLELRGK